MKTFVIAKLKEQLLSRSNREKTDIAIAILKKLFNCIFQSPIIFSLAVFTYFKKIVVALKGDSKKEQKYFRHRNSWREQSEKELIPQINRAIEKSLILLSQY